MTVKKKYGSANRYLGIKLKRGGHSHIRGLVSGGEVDHKTEEHQIQAYSGFFVSNGSFVMHSDMRKCGDVSENT